MEQTLDLTPEEQESLAIGEELAGQEQEMLAGKFEDAKIVTVSVLAYVAASMTRAHRNSLAHDFLAFLFISSSSS